jgi:hypothetical protein
MPSDHTEHQHTPEEEREIREAALDETIAATFPASDPLSTIPNPQDETALERKRPDRGRGSAGRDS